MSTLIVNTVKTVNGSDNLSVSGGLAVNGDTILGDASADTMTFNGSTLAIPNNLNIDSNTLYIDSANNKVAVGTATPGSDAHLTVNGNIQMGNGGGGSHLHYNTTNLYFHNADNGIEAGIINGKFGVGTLSPGKTLGVNAADGNALRLIYNDTSNYADFSVSSGGDLTINASGGDLTLSDNVTISGDLTVNGTTTTVNSVTMSVDDPNITINGIDSPTDVNANGGGITLKGTSDKKIEWLNATNCWTTNQGFRVGSGDFFADGDSTLGNATGDSITFQASTLAVPNNLNIDSNTLFVDSTNNKVAVGTTTSGTDAILTVNGNLQIGNGGGGSQLIYNATNLYFNNVSNGIEAAIINGKFGIGTTSPSELLHVAGNAKIDGNLEVVGTLDVNVEDFKVNANSLIFGDASGDAVTFNASTAATPNGLNFDSNTLVIDASNNRVGVGLASPTQTLDVNGTIKGSTVITTGKLLELGTGTSGTPSGDAGIIIERGSSDNAVVLWDESRDEFVFGTTSATFASSGDLTFTRANLSAERIGAGTEQAQAKIHAITDIAASPSHSTNAQAIFEDNNRPAIQLVGSANNIGLIQFGDNAAMAAGQLYYDHSSDKMRFDVAGSEQITLADGVLAPAATNDVDLGTADLRFKNMYTMDLHLANDRGDWTIIEEEDYLSLRNNKNGKMFKILMQEISEE
tara:strand:- start:2889 stop:4952 length:2064 start_codon:yes stop_codon:yes gene_type:complete